MILTFVVVVIVVTVLSFGALSLLAWWIGDDDYE